MCVMCMSLQRYIHSFQSYNSTIQREREGERQTDRPRERERETERGREKKADDQVILHTFQPITQIAFDINWIISSTIFKLSFYLSIYLAIILPLYHSLHTFTPSLLHSFTPPLLHTSSDSSTTFCSQAIL